MKAINELKKGQFFRLLPNGKETFQYAGYCRETKKYVGESFDDISRYTYKKKGTLVLVDFEF
jgi:hypothetical protein